MFLKGAASLWYDHNVDSLDRVRDLWSFKLVITSLYDRFIHTKAMRDANNKFWNAMYVPDEGVMSFYY